MSPLRPAALLAALALAGCGPEPCATVTDIEGVYACTGECLVTEDGERSLARVAETDSVAALPGATEALYEVHVRSTGFWEVEIGALVGTTLRTATAAVSDATYPVVETYEFEAGAGCRAEGFTKVVRGLDPPHFKACAIRCQRAG